METKDARLLNEQEGTETTENKASRPDSVTFVYFVSSFAKELPCILCLPRRLV
jgi:hypothetical protein